MSTVQLIIALLPYAIQGIEDAAVLIKQLVDSLYKKQINATQEQLQSALIIEQNFSSQLTSTIANYLNESP
jgi:hypothetical protein